MQCTKCGAEVQPGATVCPSCEARIVPSKQAVAAPRRRDVGAAANAAAKPAAKPSTKPAANLFANLFAKSSVKPAAPAVDVKPGEPSAKIAGPRKGLSANPTWLGYALIAVVVVLAIGGAWLAFSTTSAGANTPDAAAVRFLQALAVYDAKGLIDNTTHASFDATNLAGFQRDAPNKAAALSGQPDYKDIKVKSVTASGVNPDDPNTRVVFLSVQKRDPGTGAYAAQEISLTVVLSSSGKWLVLWN